MGVEMVARRADGWLPWWLRTRLSTLHILIIRSRGKIHIDLLSCTLHKLQHGVQLDLVVTLLQEKNNYLEGKRNPSEEIREEEDIQLKCRSASIVQKSGRLWWHFPWPMFCLASSPGSSTWVVKSRKLCWWPYPLSPVVALTILHFPTTFCTFLHPPSTPPSPLDAISGLGLPCTVFEEKTIQLASCLLLALHQFLKPRLGNFFNLLPTESLEPSLTADKCQLLEASIWSRINKNFARNSSQGRWVFEHVAQHRRLRSAKYNVD